MMLQRRQDLISLETSWYLAKTESTFEFKGVFRDKVAAVSNASLQLSALPADTRAKVKRAAEEYTRLKRYVKDYGSTDSRTKTQAKKFRSAIEAAYPAVKTI